MVELSTVILILQVSVLAIIVPLSLIYSISLTFIQRIRHRTHVFTINICMAIFCCSLYWLIYFIITEINIRRLYNPKTCFLVFYAQETCTLQVPLSLMTVSIHRLCCVIYYNKMFFKSKRWISMCVICQWIVGLIIPLPLILKTETACVMSPWMRYYSLATIILIPVPICVLINIIIFKYVKSSTRRIRPISQSTMSNHRLKFSRRDIHLLRHMIIMFFVFVAGWSPIYITSVIMNRKPIDQCILRSLSLLAEISLLCDIIDLFLYSHKLREYLRRIVLPCCYAAHHNIR